MAESDKTAHTRNKTEERTAKGLSPDVNEASLWPADTCLGEFQRQLIASIQASTGAGCFDTRLVGGNPGIVLTPDRFMAFHTTFGDARKLVCNCGGRSVTCGARQGFSQEPVITLELYLGPRSGTAALDPRQATSANHRFFSFRAEMDGNRRVWVYNRPVDGKCVKVTVDGAQVSALCVQALTFPGDRLPTFLGDLADES